METNKTDHRGALGSVEHPEAVAPESYDVLSYTLYTLPAAYQNYILSRWMIANRDGNSYFRLAEKTSYFSAYQVYVKRLLTETLTNIRVAVLRSDPDVILGFSVGRDDDGLLHFVYVHRHHHRSGIGKSLVPFRVKMFTHLTESAVPIWNSKFPRAVFNPFAV
jgi:GNAT superfamily N-acetyltransferase